MIAPEQLATLLADLRSSGFTIGLPEHQRVLDLLLQLEISGSAPHHPDRLCNMLAAILCRSAEQQVQFRRRFNNYFGELRSYGGGLDSPEILPIEVREGVDDPGFWELLTAAERQMFKRLATVFALIFLLSIVLPDLMVLLGLLMPRVEITVQPPSSHSLFLGLLALLRSLMLAPEAAAESAGSALGAWILFVAIPVFVIAGLWIVSPSRAFAAYLKRQRLDFRPEFVRLLVRSVAPNLFRERQVYRDIQTLRRPRLVDSTELDIDASLAATLDHAGLFTPVLARRTVAPEHLFLIERRSENDHVARLAEQLVTVLREAQVFVEVYWFASDIRRLSRSDDVPASTFEEVAGRHVDHRLVLVTSGESFFDPANRTLQDWAQLVRLFERRILFTPTSPALWGYREEALHVGLQIPVLLLDPGSLREAVDRLSAEEPLPLRPPARGSPEAAPQLARLTDLLEERPVRWSEVWTPEAGQQQALDLALREGLGADEHAWLAAAAVYPELNWNLTLHLGNALFTDLRLDQLAGRVLALANLPWFRAGRMPIWLRQQLTHSMPAELYNRVRRVLGGLLLTVLRPAQRNLALEVGLRHSSEALQDSGERLSAQMEDPVLIDFMTRRRRDRTVVRLPRMLARLVSGGLLHNVFSNDQIQDLEAAAEMMNRWVVEEAVAAADVASAPKALGAEFRILTLVFNSAGLATAPSEPLYLYLPIGKQPARLLEETSVVLYHYRRRCAWLLSVLNVGVVLLAAAMLYNDAYRTTHSSIGVLWIVLPPLVLHLILVRPVMHRFALFPGFLPETQPSHLSNRFSRILNAATSSVRSFNVDANNTSTARPHRGDRDG